jgi:uncharacterized membrane protein YfcA
MPTGQFALCFALLYAIVKWNYVVPLLLRTSNAASKLKKSQQLLLIGFAGFGNGAVTLLWGAPSLSPAFPYLVLLSAVVAVVNNTSEVMWIPSVLATVFSCLHVVREGEVKHAVVCGLLTVYLLYASSYLTSAQRLIFL